MSRLTSTISFGNDSHDGLTSSYASMTQNTTGLGAYTGPIKSPLKHRKSDIFNLTQETATEVERNPRKQWDRNASTVFDADVAADYSKNRNSKYHLASNVFNSPSFERFAAQEESMYVPSNTNEIKRQLSASHDIPQLPSGNRYEEEQEVAIKTLLKSSQEPLESGKYLPHQQHSDIFSDAGDSQSHKGARRHFEQSKGYSDIFNLSDVSKAAESSPAAGKRRSSLPLPQWNPESSFSNLFGAAAADAIKSQQTPHSPKQQERKIPLERVSGLSSNDLNRERSFARGRPTFHKAQDQFKSQIWF